MDKLKELLQDNLNIELCSAVLSNPRQKEAAEKIKVRPLLQKEKLLFQIETFRNHQAFHRNVEPEEACKLLQKAMENMRQMQIETRRYLYTVLVSKKGKVTIKKKALACERKEIDLSHNRKKHYILEEGVPVPFLLDLGVMTEEGKVVNSRFDKFRQINRFLEFIEDILPELDWSREVTIIDFGCGKSYLTFAMYYYLHECKGYNIRIIGLDLKKEVIRHCSELGRRYGYEKLTFLEGDIAGYTGADHADMVVTLHACDTATDYALAKAVGWGAKVILSVPCCQHELNGQIENDILKPILKYGLLKERMAALVTDGLRAEYLECAGYDTQILEFIDMEHTPKNILIRGVKNGKKGENQKAVKKCEEFLHVSPTLGRLLE
ncbi:MAG: SAM-dependent methyltransferase [Dorea sp.]|uniref:class I SAM-dependent methyltransferase n=1 Tax=Sporofaciens musculi TaxID=2681861 RepID=UPI00216C77EA|nr:SAM-dependent methyltransferase [Sporofaciens musculi]MCI9422005.1 SAM-dependent methyltransferase [Dorea sp.]